jgi:hypothetical protein
MKMEEESLRQKLIEAMPSMAMSFVSEHYYLDDGGLTMRVLIAYPHIIEQMAKLHEQLMKMGITLSSKIVITNINVESMASLGPMKVSMELAIPAKGFSSQPSGTILSSETEGRFSIKMSA